MAPATSSASGTDAPEVASELLDPGITLTNRFECVAYIGSREVLGPELPGDTALELFRNGHFDLVVSDVRMPGMDGINLFREVRKIAPDQKFVFLSASTAFYDDHRSLEILKKESNGFLGKPYRIEELQSFIRSVLS